MSINKSIRIILLCYLSYLLSGCLAVPLVASEFIPNGNSEFERSGKELQTLAQWGKAKPQSTISATGGKESWLCAEKLDNVSSKYEDIQFVCVDANVKLSKSQNTNFKCMQGKGTLLGFANKNSFESLYCK